MKKILLFATLVINSAHAVEFKKLTLVLDAAQKGVMSIGLQTDSVQSVTITNPSDAQYVVKYKTTGSLNLNGEQHFCSREITVSLTETDGEYLADTYATTCD